MTSAGVSDEALAQVLWTFHNVSEPPRRADLILGLGSYDLRVADYCAELFHQGLAPFLVFSGASGNWTRGRWKATEAEVFAERAIKAGVPQEVIGRETKATNIAENLAYTRNLLCDLERQVARVVVVTKPNTMRRVAVCVPKQWPDVDVCLSAPPLKLSDQVTSSRSLKEMIEEMVGDLQRLMVYPKLGYTESVDIPDAVMEAFYALVDRGYDAHLMPDQGLPVPRKTDTD